MDASMAEKDAEIVLKENNLHVLPVNPKTIAERKGILVEAKSVSNNGVSGMLIRVGNEFAISYATHFGNKGFENFSIAHELGHYFLPGHVDELFHTETIHYSNAGFVSNQKIEREADAFAAGLLMPASLVQKEIDQQDVGLVGIEKLAERCGTSLTASAIRYSQLTPEPMAIVISQNSNIQYCWMSNSLKTIRGMTWIKKNTPLPKNSLTLEFNGNPINVSDSERAADTRSFMDWFGGQRDYEMSEEIVGLGGYGKTLTVLCLEDDLDQIEEDEEQEGDWSPRFHK